MAVNDISLVDLSQIALQEATRAVPALNSFSTTFKTGLQYKDATLVPIYSAGSSSSAWDDTTNNYNTANSNVVWKQATLSNRFKESTDIRDYQTSKLDPIKTIQVNTRKVVRDVIADLMSLVTAASCGAAGVTAASASFNGASVNTLATIADTSNWDLNRALLLNPVYYSALRTIYQNYNAFGDAQIAKSGIIGDAVGFNVIQIPGLPDNSEHLVGIALDQSALGLVIGTITPDSTTVEYEEAVDPASGLTIGVRKHYDYALGRTLVTVELVTAKTLGTSQISRIVSQ